MERQTCVWFTTVLLLAVFNSALGEIKYVGLDQSLVLTLPEGLAEHLTNIVWKHSGNLVADWSKVPFSTEYYGAFNGRTTLNTNTGRLEIKRMTKEDTGAYSVDVNNKVKVVSYDVKVVNKVPKPTVSVKPLACNPAMDSCKLTCDGDTTEAEPVTYSWKMGDGKWKESEKDLTIYNSEKSIKMFSCKMKNIVNEEESEPHSNPFLSNTDSTDVGLIVGVVVFVLFLVGVGVMVVLGFWKRVVIINWLWPPQITDPASQQFETVVGGTRDPPQEETPFKVEENKAGSASG